MNLSEALKISKATGAVFERGEWVVWDDGHRYRFSGEAIIADDWEPLTDRDRELVAAYEEAQCRQKGTP